MSCNATYLRRRLQRLLREEHERQVREAMRVAEQHLQQRIAEQEQRIAQATELAMQRAGSDWAPLLDTLPPLH